MKKPFKLAKMTVLKFGVVTVVSVTFFIVGTLVFAAWQGPTQQPPDGNPAGFIFNSSVPQPAQFNVTGSGTVGSLTVSNNAAVGGDAIVIGSICFNNQDDENCKDSWAGISDSLWASDDGGFIYNTNRRDLGGGDYRQVKIFPDAYLQITNMTDFIQLAADYTREYSEVRWGKDTNDRLRFVFENLAGSSQEIMTLLPSGNVGIGTAVPGYKLDVAGQIAASASNIPFVWTGYGNNKDVLSIWGGNTPWVSIVKHINAQGFAFPAGDSFSLYRRETYGNPATDVEIFTVKGSTGNVGIGTTEPTQAKLQVQTTIGNAIAGNLGTGFTGITRAAVFALDSISDSTTHAFYDAGGSKNAFFSPVAIGASDPGSAKLYVKGNVGIGTTNPGAKLEVVGQVKITGGSPGAGKVLTSDATGLASWATPSSGGIGGSGTANYVAKFTGSSTIGNSTIYDSGSNIGIGTTAPGHKLEVLGSNNVVNFRSSGDQAYVRVSADGGGGLSERIELANRGNGVAAIWVPGFGDALKVMRNGDVGIGRNPSSGVKLEVAGQVKITGGSPGAGKVLTSDASGLATWQAPSGGADLWSQSGSNIYYNSGNVGIGTTNPTHDLTIIKSAPSNMTTISVENSATTGDGSTRAQIALVYEGSFTIAKRGDNGNEAYGGQDGVLFWNEGPGDYIWMVNNTTEVLRIKDSGNVGIGTASPAAKLDVGGGINASGDIVADNNVRGSCVWTSWSSSSSMCPNEKYMAGINIYVVLGVGGQSLYCCEL